MNSLPNKYCVHCKTQEQAEKLFNHRLIKNYCISNAHWGTCGDSVAYRISNGEILGYCSVDFYKEYTDFGPVLEFDDWVNLIGGMTIDWCDSLELNEELCKKEREELHNRLNRSECLMLCTTSAWPIENPVYTTKNLRDLRANMMHDEIVFNKEYECIWEWVNKNMFEITITESYRIDKTNNTKIKTYTTRVKTSLGKAEVTCDEDDYNYVDGPWIAAAKITASKSEECNMMFGIAMDLMDLSGGSEISCAIINKLADRACGGSFDKAYTKWCKEQERKSTVERTCKTCGKKFNTPEEARAHEKWHIENKRTKHERYMIRHEAKRRLAEAEREDKIKNAMKFIEVGGKNDG